MTMARSGRSTTEPIAPEVTPDLGRSSCETPDAIPRRTAKAYLEARVVATLDGEELTISLADMVNGGRFCDEGSDDPPHPRIRWG